MEVVMVMVMVALVLFINTNSCGASFVPKSNVTSYRQCIATGAMDGCLIADDLDFDFFMDTHVVRFLNESELKQSGGGGRGASGTGYPNKEACYKDHPGDKYLCNPQKGNCGGSKYCNP